MAVVAGDTIYVVLAHLGSGEIVGVYSTLANAQAVIGVRPGCTYRIITISVDVDTKPLVQQGNVSTVSPSGSASIPSRKGIKDGKSEG